MQFGVRRTFKKKKKGKKDTDHAQRKKVTAYNLAHRVCIWSSRNAPERLSTLLRFGMTKSKKPVSINDSDGKRLQGRCSNMYSGH